TITQPSAALTLSETHTNVSCYGGTNGTINITPSGGTGIDTYLWSDDVTTQNRTGLSAITYTVTATDANGCTATKSVTITQPSAALTLSETHTNVSCYGGTNGTINITPSG